MKSKTMGIALTALATVALTTSLALARPGGQGGQGPGYGPCGGPADCPGAVQLSPEKQEAFKKLFQAHYAKVAPMRAALEVKRAELNAAAVAATPDQAKIEALSKEIGDLHGKLVAEQTQFRIQVVKEIGPEALPRGGMGFGRGHGHGGWGGRGCQ